MENETSEKAYLPKEISLTLDIGDSTLRKWCIALEKDGYGFIRNDKNNRVFVESDLVVLRHFQNLVKQHNMQLDNAAKLVIDRFGKGVFSMGTGIVPVEKEVEQRSLERSNEDIMNALEEHIEKQDNFNRELLARLDQQQKYFEDRMRQEIKDRELLESLKESMMEQKQLQLEMAATQEEQKKKGFFARLFRN